MGLTPEQFNRKVKKATEKRPVGKNVQVFRNTRENISKIKSNQCRPLENYRNHISRFSILNTPDWFNYNDEVDISIIVPLYKSKNQVKHQIETWLFEEVNYEIIYVNDFCPDDSYKQVLISWEQRKLNRPIGKIIKVEHCNIGFGQACNLGAYHAKGKYLIFLNADTEITDHWVEPLYKSLIKNHNIGIIGNLQLNLNDRNKIESMGSEWSWNDTTFLHIGRQVINGERIKGLTFSQINDMSLQEREMVTGCCFIIRSDLFFDLQGFDPRFLMGYWEDSDLNLRVRSAGYKVYFEPKSIIYHSPGHSGGNACFIENKSKFINKWIKNDRIHNLVKSNKPVKTIKENIKDDVIGCVIVCNEEEFLEISVESIASIVDKWIFVVGGNEFAYKSGMCNDKGYPNDNTLEICKKLSTKYDCKIIEPPGRLWKDKVEMRNAYASLLKPEQWMFMLDGDEVYKDEQLWRIAELMEFNEVIIMQFWLFWNNLQTIGNGNWDNFRQERIVKWKQGYKYSSNHLFVSHNNSLVKDVRPCFNGNERLFYHYSWIRPIEKIRQKLNYYVYQTGLKNINYVDDVFLKWRENPSLVNETHPMGGGGTERFRGIHPQAVIDKNFNF